MSNGQKKPPAPHQALAGHPSGHLGVASVSTTGGSRDYTIAVGAGFGLFLTPLIELVDKVIHFLSAVETPNVSEAIDSYVRNLITRDDYECLLRLAGADPTAYDPAMNSRAERLSPREAIQWVRRTKPDGISEDDALRASGFVDPGHRQAFSLLYDELPTISDHLHWLQRNVFDDEYVKHFQLMDGFEERFWPKFGDQLRALGMTKENAGLHYAAHWINPSFSQQFSMVQRLRSGRVPNSLVFTREDLLRTMQEMDVGVYFRERLEAISHPIPNLTLCLQMYQFGTVGDGEFIEMLKDLGFSDADADKILQAQIIKVRRLNASRGHGWTPAALANAYAVGRITDQQVRDEMTYLGYQLDAADRLMRRAEIELAISPVRRIQKQSIQSALTTQENAYKCGAIDATQLGDVYKTAGIPENVAQIATANIDSEIAVALCNQQISSFKRALLTGKATLDQIQGIMQSIGVPELRIAQYLKAWVIEAQLKAPQATAAQILRWVGLGLLDRDTASVRLLNLGWSDPDLTLLLTESLAKLARLQQTLQRQSAKSQKAAATAALKAAKQAQTLSNQLRSQLRGIAPMSTLRKWYKINLLTDAEFLEYAIARGYPEKEAIKYLEEARLEKNKPPKPPKVKATKGPTGNGTTAGTTGQAPPPPPPP